MTKTEKLTKTIEKLEREMAASAARRKELEQALATAYNDEGDTMAAHEALSAFKGLMGDKVGVLRSLDKQLRDTSATERETIDNQIAAEAEKKRQKALAETLRFVGQIESGLSSHVGADLARDAHRRIAEIVENDLDIAFFDWKSAQLKDRMPPEFKNVPTRDELGRVTY